MNSPAAGACMRTGGSLIEPLSTNGDSEQPSRWIERREIRGIEGALKPSAYVGRAYQYAKAHRGRSPEWATKKKGHWLFRRSYIEADARANLKTIGVTEAAKLLGATRRAIQDWIDEGIIPIEEEREKGEPRRIPREPFQQRFDELKKRLETPAIVGYRLKHGHDVAPEVIERIDAEREKRAAATRRRERERLEETRREEERRRIDKLEARLRASEQAKSRADEEKQSAEQILQQKARAEEEAAAREKELRRQLQAAEKATRAAERERRSAEHKVHVEQETAATERLLGRKFSRLVRAAKSRYTRTIEEQRRAAEAARKRAEEERLEANKRLKAAKQRSAAAAEAQLKAAREAHLRAVEWDTKASGIAERIANDMFDDRITRIQAMALFNKITEEQGVPLDVLVSVRKQFFGR